ncbi:MAG TPA: hypothetical protein VKD04_12555 [Burkholderiales bacterium]|nr:hypothetical protein [Burkholderiales bacterium]
MAADLGIKEKDRLKIVQALEKLLADSHTPYLQIQNFMKKPPGCPEASWRGNSMPGPAS